MRNILLVILLASCGDNITPGPDAGHHRPSPPPITDPSPESVEVQPDAGAPDASGQDDDDSDVDEGGHHHHHCDN